MTLRGLGEAEIGLERPSRTFLEQCTDRNHQLPGRFNASFLGDRLVCIWVRCLYLHFAQHFILAKILLREFCSTIEFSFPPIYLQKAPPHHPNAFNEG